MSAVSTLEAVKQHLVCLKMAAALEERTRPGGTPATLHPGSPGLPVGQNIPGAKPGASAPNC